MIRLRPGAVAGLAVLLAGGLASTVLPRASSDPAGAVRTATPRASGRDVGSHARGCVAIVHRRAHKPFASGVLIAVDRALTCRHATHIYSGSPTRRRPEALEVAVEQADGSLRRFPVAAYAHTSEAYDLCVLALGRDAAGRLPAADRVQTLSRARAALGDPLYVVHHPHGGPREIAYGAHVRFPYEATPDELARMVGALRLEGGGVRASAALEASYQDRGRRVFENRSMRWAHQPVLGADCATVPGSSGAPVFHGQTHALLGILFAGVRGPRPAGATAWDHHEAILPSAAILGDLARSRDPVCRALGAPRD